MNFMSERDTIAAISTPPGSGGVGMVRITGPDAMAVGRKIFTPLGQDSTQNLHPRKAVVGNVHHPDLPDEPIDQAVCLFFKNPRSFTGEDTIELTAHGSPFIMRSILEAATLAGARLAEPGEFTRRAFNNGRIDLSQAEAIASLIFASTEEASRVMQRQVAGTMGREAKGLRESLLGIKVELESVIDFSEDVGDIQPDKMAQVIKGVKNNVENLLDTAREGVAMTQGLRVVIAGAPNVGKSSLLNALLQEDRAIVHEVAGTTRDFIEGRISVNGIPMVVVDTAGIRGEADPLESEGIARTKNLVKVADLLLVVMDGTRSMNQDERQLLLETTHIPRVVAVNKNDLSLHPAFEAPEGAVTVSALTSQGIDTLKELIRETCIGGGDALNDGGGVVTSIRQADALKKVRDGCDCFIQGLMEFREPELLAVDLEEALLGVGELTGEVTVDEVLDEIFSRFCIGK